ncbi:ABC transporter [Theileria orientalis strain Shintoku]|uniref:ABC transporter n=1 Tax=Theileria orientalis strain Shintoku TaxID=869250 RepID=J4D9V7_THEOR|nr:ABC transporter [Theileria orientalis strain Shintoku]BAM41625.1 ABC transporter [Theileria orientalis strain Shintoku]|eukprot:XP_009691926.1 ABC transporter [Theileria orientalis strain Shintoku]
MNERSYNKNLICEDDPDSLFWDSELYHKSYFKNRKNKGFRYYDETSVLKYLFFHWVNRWVSVLSKKYIEPYKLHPLQVSDQILKWEPIFSKHVSDGLVRLDLHEATKTSKKPVKPYGSILLRAILLTSWRKSIVLFLGLVVGNVLSMSISILVKKLLEILNDPSIHVSNSILLLLAIMGFHILDGIILENVNYYLYRMIYTLHYLYGTVPYRHSLSHRRVFYNNINGKNILNTCDQVLHSCDPHSQCSKNPLFCPALRYQSKEVTPKIFTYVFYDSFNIAMAFESTKFIVQFLTNFIYGVYLLSRHVKGNLWVLYVTGSLFLFFMVVIEIFNAVIFKYVIYMRDYKVTKYNDILGSLSIIKKMLIDDIGFNIITQTRNNELSLIVVKIFITFVNMFLFSTTINVSFYIIKMYFVKSVNNAAVITDINTAAFMTTFYIYMRIVTSMFLIPRAINIVGMAVVCYKRLNKYLSGCPPNFYAADNKFVGSTQTSAVLTDVTDQIPINVIVYFKDAAFTWVNSRQDLLNKNYKPFLKNVNFELKRSEMAIVTGVLGSGKSNFIKSMLGEMTLVGGSMAVIPLHTSMPIFYASEDIFLKQGTIRSNITFGYKFDEEIYNTVLKAVDLEFDISTWENGDLRVVSDKAHSLSGGQRVRVEMARAIYAYLIFHNVNKEYNNNQCSFLMCLDSSLHGLDPYVSKTIFNNLFNIKTGLLVKDDLSVVLTTSKQILDICIKSCEPAQFQNTPIYNIKNRELKFVSTIHNFMKNKKHEGDFKYLTSSRTGPYTLNGLTNDMLGLCLSNTSRSRRVEIIKNLYQQSFVKYIKDHFGNAKFNPYLVFMKPAMVTFSIYIILTVAFNILDYLKFVFSTNLSDFITKNINDFNKGALVDLAGIKSRSNSALRVTVIFVSVIIVLSFLATVALTAGSIVSCRKLHEYCINTIFNYSSSVVKIKRQINQVITFLSGDLMMTDDITGFNISLVLLSFIQAATNIITLFYLIPISVPFILLTLVLIYIYILMRYINTSVALNFGFMESLAQMNSVIESSISGWSVYRSFNRNSDLLGDFLEHRDYNARTKFLFAAAVSWSTILFTWIFPLTTFIILVIPIVLDKFTKHKMTVGYFGLALSLCTNVNKSFSDFSFMYACTRMVISSIERFRYFIPLGTKLRFDKSPNTHEEHLINPTNKDVSDLDKKQLLKRRAIEFKSENRKFYGLRRLFYHPKIHILDVGKYITPEHTGVELKDVCVYTSLDRNPESMILKHLTVTANKSEIIGMVGRTGAGKTTLLSVLQNIVSNRTGQVLLDGKDLNEIPRVVLRQIIGVLPQLPFVFKGWTIRRFLDPRKLFNDDDINSALNQCGLLEFVTHLSGGKLLDTILAPEEPLLYYKKQDVVRPNTLDNGKSKSLESSKSGVDNELLLSYNQLRTLSLARLVLYRQFFRLIVVDEPPEEDLFDPTRRDDDLGVPIYELIQKYFSHCTTFVVAHDATVLKSCTSVWVIHEGRLVKTCKASDVSANESIASIIEQNVKKNEPQHVNTVM